MRHVRRSFVFVGAGMLAAGLSAGVVADGAVTAGASAHRANHVSVPKGWKSYSYGGITVSVPQSWAVKHNTNCPNTSAPGALLLGYPKVLEDCANYEFSLNFVAIYRLYPTKTTTPTPIMVNSLPVDALRASTNYTVWSVPSLGIEMTGEGAQSL